MENSFVAETYIGADIAAVKVVANPDSTFVLLTTAEVKAIS
jgi:hypothetical protein